MRYRLLFPLNQVMVDYVFNKPLTEYVYEPIYESTAPEGPHAREVTGILQRLWQRHNIGDRGDDNRPLARTHRSMCIGDIVILEGCGVWVAEPVGFRQLTEGEFWMVRVVGSLKPWTTF